MDNQSQDLKRALPNTPRVCDKIVEYYQKFGHDRDLEKFMRLYSPSSSQDSQKTQGGNCGSAQDSCGKRIKTRKITSLTSSSEALAMIPHNSFSVCGMANSKSLPNIEVQGQVNRKEAQFPSDDVTVDINIETEGVKKKIISISTENLETPNKTFKNMKTQTPESVAKSHRRLEWDSLGDVGYKKSMSTSNISTIERSLLKEFFKDNSVVSEPGTSAAAIYMPNTTEEKKTLEKIKASEIEYTTPPLASSTLVEAKQMGAKPKMISQSTSSTSLHKKFEKYAQTSLIKPPNVHSQEIQCTMSSSNSIMGGTATPSSFEYYSSRSSRSGSSKSLNFIANNVNLQKQIRPKQQHPFITSITDLLIKRKSVGEKNQQKHYNQLHNLNKLQTKFQAVLEENKENQSQSTLDSMAVTSFSLKKQAPELDLGIQLICSLIDAKSLNSREKKQLIHDIVKRLSHLEAGESPSNSTTTNSSGVTPHISTNSKQNNIYDSVRSNIRNSNILKNLSKLEKPTELGVSPLNLEAIGLKDIPEKPVTTNSICEDSHNILVEDVNPEPLYNPESPPKYKGYCKQFPCKIKDQHENALKIKNNGNVLTASTINTETQNELIIRTRKRQNDNQITTSRKQTESIPTNGSTILKENKTSRSTQTSRTISSITSSITTTPDVTTQKIKVSASNELRNSNTDAEQPTMREWLNPLTQSEVDYEEKKRQEMRKKVAAQRENIQRRTKHNYGRVQQLNWIENEIKRLECLKHLLQKDETSERSSSATVSSLEKNLTVDSTQTEKLYDTVYSNKSSVLSESAERLVQEIEIILEESNEDAINLEENLKRIKDHKKETQVVYEKEVGLVKEENFAKIKPNCRTIKEINSINDKQLICNKETEIIKKQRRQREKIDTPSTGKSEDSESLRDLVQQRKREFIAAYKIKKQHHYEALKQQQKDFKYLNTQHEEMATDSEQLYSVPHILPKKYISNNIPYAYTQHPLTIIPTQPPSQKVGKFSSHNPKSYHIIYSKAANTQLQFNECNKIISSSSGHTNTTTTSSSSIFCMSSDVSVPMGSQNTSSTPTTTHQYDDVSSASVAGVATQTSDSILRSKAIYGPTRSLPLSSTNACAQVKPKSIAYVIEFADNKHTTSNSTSDTNTTSNNLHIKSSVVTPTEPQITLQQYLEKNKPKFLQKSKERKAILIKLQSMRQERDRQLREIIENSSLNSLDKRLQYLPPPPIQKLRILNTKEMKALTNKRFSSLPEVIAKQERDIEERKRRGNRILKDVFIRRLNKRVRSGKLSLNHSKTVI